MPKPHHAATAGGPVAGKTQCRKGVAPSWLAKGSIFHREQRAHMAQQLVIASHCSVLLSYSHASSRACLLAHLERGNQLEVLQHPPPGPCHTHILQAFPKVPSPKANYLQPTWHNPTAPTLHGHAVAALAQVVSGNGIQKWLLATLCNTLLAVLTCSKRAVLAAHINCIMVLGVSTTRPSDSVPALSASVCIHLWSLNSAHASKNLPKL